MNKLHFEVTINAPKEKVWDTMIGAETYPQWTDIFMPGSNFQGSWEQGSKIIFTAPDENGKEGGMLARVATSKPYEFISLEHYGQIVNGTEDTTSEDVKQWAGAHENYTFEEVGGGTKVTVDVDTPDEYKEEMEKIWPQALDKLRVLAEV